MARQSSDAILSAVFVDYDNIYLSLRRKNEEAARRFAKDTGRWLAALQSGELISNTSGSGQPVARRMVMNRCYGNPVPRRNQSDNSTDMNSFPFVRQHFLRNGFEIVDCPPLTAQLKNSSDIKMVMDLRDFLTHETYFDEFIILSSDADFTPVLHRLRAHDRRTAIFANDHTAAPYTAIADAEVREADLISLLLGETIGADAPVAEITAETNETIAAVVATKPSPEPLAAAEPVSAAPTQETVRAEIISVIAEEVRTAPAPLPLEAAAERATRILGHDLTVGSQWGGFGSFIELLRAELPDDVRLSSQNPPVLYDQSRLQRATATPAISASPEPTVAATAEPEPFAEPGAEPGAEPDAQASAEAIQRSIARIHDASQVPPLSPPDYRVLFEEMAAEITENDLQGVQTINNVDRRVQLRGIQIARENIRFALDVVGEADPWFEQGASTDKFAGRFRNFVIQRCETQGLELDKDEIDLIDAWFAGGPVSAQPTTTTTAPETKAAAPDLAARSTDPSWWQSAAGAGSKSANQADLGAAVPGEDMPRMLRSQGRL